MKMVTRLKRAKDKDRLWFNLNLSTDETVSLLRNIVLNVPPGHYRLYGRDYGMNIVDAVYDRYGKMPSLLISEELLLGMQVLYPEKIRVSFTHDLDKIEIM